MLVGLTSPDSCFSDSFFFDGLIFGLAFNDFLFGEKLALGYILFLFYPFIGDDIEAPLIPGESFSAGLWVAEKPMSFSSSKTA